MLMQWGTDFVVLSDGPCYLTCPEGQDMTYMASSADSKGVRFDFAHASNCLRNILIMESLKFKCKPYHMCGLWYTSSYPLPSFRRRDGNPDLPPFCTVAGAGGLTRFEVVYNSRPFTVLKLRKRREDKVRIAM